MPLRNGRGGLGEGVEIEEDLVPGLALMQVVDGQIEVVVRDGTLCALVHNKNRGTRYCTKLSYN